MSSVLNQFLSLTNAEDYFQFFGLAYDPKVVLINRLHILKKFSLAIQQIGINPELVAESEWMAQYRQALQQAYALFCTSTGVEQKLFKVFHDQPQAVVRLSEIQLEPEVTP